MFLNVDPEHSTFQRKRNEFLLAICLLMCNNSSRIDTKTNTHLK